MCPYLFHNNAARFNSTITQNLLRGELLQDPAGEVHNVPQNPSRSKRNVSVIMMPSDLELCVNSKPLIVNINLATMGYIGRQDSHT